MPLISNFGSNSQLKKIAMAKQKTYPEFVFYLEFWHANLKNLSKGLPAPYFLDLK